MSSKQKRPVVLYVEDEANDVFFMQKAFNRVALGCRLQSVSDGQQAIDYLAGHGAFADRTRFPLPATILLDLNLPARPGFEVLQWVRQQPELKSLPVVIFSSSGRPEDRYQARELGANDYVLKPASGLAFSDVVRNLQHHWLSASRCSGAG